MLQIPSNERLDYILAVLKDKGYDKPNAPFIEATKVEKGNASKMLQGKLSIPHKVFTTFLSKYPTPPAGWSDRMRLAKDDVEITLRDYLKVLEEKANQAERHSEKWEKQVERLEKIVNKTLDGINSNLNLAVAGVNNLTLQTQSLRNVALRSLSRIEKKPEGALLEEADNRVIESIRALEKQDMTS